jgi:hypothetical protein
LTVKPSTRPVPARSESVGIVDAVAPGQGRHHERQELVADVGPSRFVAQIEVGIDPAREGPDAGPGWPAEEAHISHQTVIVKGRVKPVEAVRRSHLSGVLPAGSVLS